MSASRETSTINGFGSVHVLPAAVADTPLANGFTAVNGKPSPPPGAIGETTGSAIARDLAQKSIDPTSTMDEPGSARPRSEDVMQVDTGSRASGSPSESLSDDSITSSPKRKRSFSDETPIRLGDGNPATQTHTSGQTADDPAHMQSGNQSVGWAASSQQGMPAMSDHAPAYLSQEQGSREGTWYGDRTQHRQSLSIDDAGMERLRNEVSNMGQRSYHAVPHGVHGGTPANMMPPTIETTAAGVQVDPRKRKRNFSNRTKTGCQTCRKRKKKCDEEKPECNNCKRGGFVCEGYTTKTTWSKSGTQNRPQPMNLQPKEYTGETGGLAPRPPQHAYSDGYQPAAASEYSRGSYTYETPNRPPQSRERSPDLQPGPSYTDPSRSQQSYDDKMQHVTSRGQQIQQFTPSSGVGPRNVVQTAQLAEHAMQSSSSPYPQPHATVSALATPSAHHTSEKQKMLTGRSYWAYAPELISEREACKAALWRFNQAQNPSMGVSREERARKFRQIITPEPNEGRRPPTGGGRCGQNVEVEAPFNCSYGYNIDIADNVLIEANCFIEDAAVVHIGRSCVIGPNVCIYTNAVSTDVTNGVGRESRNEARTVTIEDNVYIGGSVVIRPGILIKKGSVIHTGSVVDKEVPGHVEWGPTSTGDTLMGRWSR